MRTLTVLAVTAVTAASLSAQTASTPRARRVAADIVFLASDALRGRKACSPGNDSAAAYLARQLRRAGLRPAGDSGTFLQHWTVGNATASRNAGIAGCRTENVAGMIPGAGALAGETVILGAHFDHLGIGGFGASMAQGADTLQVHHGADDNASGAAAIVELARTLAADPRALGRNHRAILFMTWNAEEEGALGSAFYADHPSLPLDSALAYLNFDMVGRLRERKLLVLGARTATEWPALLDSVNARWHLDVRASGDGWGPSDQSSFAAHKRPVLHFFTDLHEDYHRPSDTADKIDADGIVDVVDFAADVARRLATRPTMLTYVDVPQPAPVMAGEPGRSRPVLGTIPDMSDEPGGVRLSGVRTSSPADSAGLRAGDILVGLAADTIANLQDFQNALMKHSGGDRVEVRYLRGGQLVHVMVTLGGR
jgi:hypothetical protein